MVSGLTDTYLCQIRSGTTVTSCRLTGNQRKTCPEIRRGLRITSYPCYNECRLIFLYPRSLTQTAVRQGRSGSPDDMERLSALAGEDALVLLTCENESASGGYLNRRVVFARENKK